MFHNTVKKKGEESCKRAEGEKPPLEMVEKSCLRTVLVWQSLDNDFDRCKYCSARIRSVKNKEEFHYKIHKG